MSNKVEPSARLGDAEELAVKHAPCHTIPEFVQCAENDSEISSTVGREKAWNVFENDHMRESVAKQSCEFVKQAGMSSIKSRPLACSSKRNILAWESCAPDFGLVDFVAIAYLSNVSNLLNIRPVAL
jgi:hypothetical protein